MGQATRPPFDGTTGAYCYCRSLITFIVIVLHVYCVMRVNLTIENKPVHYSTGLFQLRALPRLRPAGGADENGRGAPLLRAGVPRRHGKLQPDLLRLPVAR